MSSAGAGEADRGGLDRAALLADLRRQVLALETDLRERSENSERYRGALRNAYEQARAGWRTTGTYASWRDERITQSAVAWVLGTVFVRFCEDNGVVSRPVIAGPGKRLPEAEERHNAYLSQRPGASDRDWLTETFGSLARTNEALAGVFGTGNRPLWELAPSAEAAAGLIAFWRRGGKDGGIRYDFTDRERLDTGFLGGLYESISAAARKQYALLQTPPFIADLVLDLSLEPAVAEFGVDGIRCIDPACGSGTFLLGMFRRLLAKMRAAATDTPDRVLIARALDSVHGCDRNPFAVSITRFRLAMAALQESGERRLERLPAFPVNVAVGDALLDGRGGMGRPPSLLVTSEDTSDDLASDVSGFSERCDLLGRGSYHVVVAEPPFISVKDKAESAAYRALYPTAIGSFPLSVPFAERMFQLAVRSAERGSGGGYVGQYTSSSFTKRGFGHKLIEDFLPRAGLTHVIDTSGAYVPGHGVPTVILVGRNQPGARDVRVVRGVQGEPKPPDDGSPGLVWNAIVEQLHRPGSRSHWVSVQDEPQWVFGQFPWNLAGGGETDLMDVLGHAPRRLGDLLDGTVGPVGDPAPADVFVLGRPWFRRHPDSAVLGRAMVTGATLRDWRAEASTAALVPYDAADVPLPLDLASAWGRHLWRMRQLMKTTAGPGHVRGSEPWWTWRRWTPDRYRERRAISFASLASHNHFALVRGERAFNRLAPLLKLPDTATEDDHFAVLAVLNSSAACFWLKQVNPSVGSDQPGSGSHGEEWARPYSFAAAHFKNFPLPADPPLSLGRALHALRRLLTGSEPAAVCTAESPPSRAALDAARAVHCDLRGQMIALQEELDWTVYGAYGLLAPDESSRLVVPPGSEVPEVRLGERAFEIVLARRAAAGEAADSWFVRHGTTPVTEIPSRWPAAYRKVVQARIDAIASRPGPALIERPAYKRRWSTEPWDEWEGEALHTWLLDRCEDEELWFSAEGGRPHPRPLTVDRLADALGADAELRAVAALYAADYLDLPDAPLADVLAAVLDAEHVPYVAALRYQESGLRKRAQWERVWELQRREDETGVALGIPVPPKFAFRDFRRADFWPLRGTLDIPKERFISYPPASPDDDSTLVLGWAGWSEADRVKVLFDLADSPARRSRGAEEITPLLAGIQELLPWVRQWEEASTKRGPGAGQADAFRRSLDELRAEYGLGMDDLASWRPRKMQSRRR